MIGKRYFTGYRQIQSTTETTSLVTSVPSSDVSTVVFLHPLEIKAVELGETFPLSVNVSNVANLYDWEFKLLYESLVINATEVVEGPFLAAGGDTRFEVIRLDAYNATHGLVWANCTLLGVPNGVDGNGVLATINFTFIGVGGCTFTFSDTKLNDPNANPIVHTRIGGQIVLLSSSPVSPFKTFTIPWEENFYTVTTYSNSTVAKLEFNQSLKQISFYVNGISDTIGFCNITIPKALLRENETHPWVVLVDGKPVTSIISSNQTHTFIYFTYHHSTSHVEIIGAEAVPEFPTILIIPILAIFTLLAIISRKLLRNKSYVR